MLDGEKLRGAFSLVKLRRGEPNAWLLIKRTRRVRRRRRRDPPRTGPSSTGRTLAEPSADPPPAPAADRRGRRPTGGPAGARLVKPMLATLVDAPFDRPGWLFEVKWDGYRAIAEVGARRRSGCTPGTTRRSTPSSPRSSRRWPGSAATPSWTARWWPWTATGRSQFQLLQNYQKTGQGDLLYVVFDLLALDGKDLRGRPLVERKRLLKKLLHEACRTSGTGDHVEETGTAFFRAAVEQGLEGIIAKDGASRYRGGGRGRRRG